MDCLQPVRLPILAGSFAKLSLDSLARDAILVGPKCETPELKVVRRAEKPALFLERSS
jgi:hypothetical protein